jgi:6-phosphogluconolactonase/glucosamine-6-phosphate isomerase/deaminase
MAHPIAFSNNSDLSVAIDKILSTASKTAIAERGFFTIALSGGSLANIMLSKISAHDCSKWHFFWADEVFYWII